MNLKHMKMSLALILTLVMMVGITVNGADSNQEGNETIYLTINGKLVSFDVAPYLDNSNRTMVEVRGIAEALGAEIDWDPVTQIVTISTEETVLNLTIGSATYTINGQVLTMDTSAVIMDGRTMVPVRFVSEALGQTVAWDQVKQTVRLSNEEMASYVIVTTGQETSYDNDGNVISTSDGDDLYGQDADYDSAQFSFTDNGDGTVTDNNSGLMWEQLPMSGHLSYSEALEYVENLELGGYDDWRLPTSKELFNLSDFSTGWPFLDQDYFEFASDAETSNEGGPQDGGPQGGPPQGEDSEMAPPPMAEGADKEAGAVVGQTEGDDAPPPPMDSSDDGSVSKSEGQFWTDYYEAGTTHDGAASAFGVNHATGHIKAYPAETGGMMGKYVRAVRGDASITTNDFVDNGDGTVTDANTGLMWMEADAGIALEWEEALIYAESFDYAGYDDWRLPDVKELQSIVDYSGVYPAIDQTYFTLTVLEENEFYYFWTNTSAYFSTEKPENAYAWYVAFGYAVDNEGNDTHGAGAVRFSPKYTDSPFAGEGGDNITNSVRLVRTID